MDAAGSKCHACASAPGGVTFALPPIAPVTRTHTLLLLLLCLLCSCGIASDAAFAKVSPQYVVPGAAEKALALVLAASSE